MGYCLINGTRYYKDDRTGRVTIDDASQAEADRRTLQNQTGSRGSTGASARRSGPVNSQTSMRQTQSASGRTVRSTVPTPSRRRGAPWGWIIAIGVTAAVAAAFVYNYVHVSAPEWAIENYMDGVSSTDSTETDVDCQ